MQKTVLITGCSSGLGKATATLFAQSGWNVVATMRQPELTGDLPKLDSVWVTRLDLEDPNSIETTVARGIDRFGRIDAVINNAGFGLFGIFEATPREQIRKQFEVNLFGTMEVTRALIPHFRKNGAGLIVNISSGAGVFTLPMISLYCASKFALEGFSEALSYELAAVGVTVKVIEPGGMRGTNFGARSAAAAAEVHAPLEYSNFVAAAGRLFASLRDQALTTDQEVAQIIYEAATDGTRKFRYVATTDIAHFVQVRRETSEAQYMELMRSLLSRNNN
jgi:NAD(P)-dependent dehydrogenase (short-subunit alcohol dehydrogenase family)